jgi:DNA-binding response OmpR family regulator
MTATTSTEEESNALSKGFFDFIHKPVNPPILLARVKRAVDFFEKQNYLFMR